MLVSRSFLFYYSPRLIETPFLPQNSARQLPVSDALF